MWKPGKPLVAWRRKRYDPRPLVNAGLARLSYRQHLVRPWGFPYNVMIEPTNVCNLHCPLCPTGSGRMRRSKGYMRLDEFRLILDKVGGHCLQAQLFKDGESFLCPDIFGMIDHAHGLGIITTASTNGNAFDGDSAAALLACGLDELVFSVDGCTQETYEQYRRGGQLSRVTEAIQALAALKRARGSRHPRIVAQFIVMKHNQHEAGRFPAWARRLGADETHVKPVYLSPHSGEALWRDFLPIDHECRKYEVVDGSLIPRSATAARPCAEIWTDLVVQWNGDVVPCCYDEEGRHTLGNILEQSLEEVWLGEAFVDFRRRLAADNASLPLCARCQPL